MSSAQASSRDLTRAIEESIADSLIAAREKGAKAVALVKGPDGVRAEVAAAPAVAAPAKLKSLEG